MERDQIAFRAERVLLVEGRNDKEFFEALLAETGRGAVQVESCGGKTRLRAPLGAIAAQADFQRTCRWLGVCRDSDDDAAGAHQSLRDALEAAGLPAPRPEADEASGDGRRVRIILLPDRQGVGELEDLVWRSLVEQRPSIAGCIDALTACLSDLETPIHLSTKERVYAYLSTFEPPDRSLGVAALAGGVVPLDSSVYAKLLGDIPLDTDSL